jgi:putative endonuclease
MQLERGRLWESRAADYLEAHGLRVVARGFRCRVGELDLVCQDGRHLVVVEVRARGSGALTSAIESIGPSKRRRIVQATRYLMLRHREWHAAPIRFDVVAFDGIDSPTPEIHWIRNAFDGS